MNTIECEKIADELISTYQLNSENISWDWVRFFNTMADQFAHKDSDSHRALCMTANKCAIMFRESNKTIGGWV